MANDIKKPTHHRARIIEGQFKGLQKMINNHAILTQSLSIQCSPASPNKLVLKNHIATHVSEMLSSADEKKQTKALEELMALYEPNNVRGKE